jgi:hypothetical protein
MQCVEIVYLPAIATAMVIGLCFSSMGQGYHDPALAQLLHPIHAHRMDRMSATPERSATASRGQRRPKRLRP